MNPTVDAALQLGLKHLKTIAVVLGVAILVCFFEARDHQRQAAIVNWQNQVALASKTVEDQKGLFERQAEQLQSVQSALDSKDPQIKELEAQLKARGEQLDNATTLNVQLRKALQAQADAHQTVQPPPAGSPPSAAGRIRVDFNHSFDWIGVSGYTLTDPAEAFVTLSPGTRPLKLTAALSKDKQGAFHVYVTSSDANVAADVLVAAVDPSIRDVKWYERVGVVGSVGAADGLLVGAGLTLDVGRFTVGPMAWLTVNSQVSKFYGVTAVWRPFAR